MKRQDQEQILNLYEQWQSSGESKADFAVNHGIRPTTFYYWSKKFEQRGSESAVSSGFQHISVEGLPSTNQGELMAAIQYPCGTRLELYSSFQHLNNSYVQLLKTLTE